MVKFVERASGEEQAGYVWRRIDGRPTDNERETDPERKDRRRRWKGQRWEAVRGNFGVKDGPK